MIEAPFSSLTASYNFGTHSCNVEWQLDEDYEDCSFIVRRSPDGERNISLLKSDLMEDSRSYVDEDFSIGNRTGKIYYQVIMRHEGVAHYSSFVEASGRKVRTTEQKDKVELESEKVEKQTDKFFREEERVAPESPPQILRPINREVGIIRQIQRLESMNLMRSGVPAVILKPKKEGTLSHEGLDQDTGQDHNVFGKGRYGQKYEGGFEEPIYTRLLGKSARPDAVMPAPTGEGEKDLYLYRVRMLGEPQVKLDDVIVDLTNDFRYVLNKVDNFQFRGDKTVIIEADLVLLPRNNVVYEFPIDYTGTES